MIHAHDALLVVEVAESSLAYDRTVKLPVYARAGIPEYWIVDEVSRCVEVWRPGAADAHRVRDTLVWTPPGVTDSLEVDLVSMFDDAS